MQLDFHTSVVTVESFLISNKKLNGINPALNTLNLSFSAIIAHSNILLKTSCLYFSFGHDCFSKFCSGSLKNLFLFLLLETDPVATFSSTFKKEANSCALQITESNLLTQLV